MISVLKATFIFIFYIISQFAQNTHKQKKLPEAWQHKSREHGHAAAPLRRPQHPAAGHKSFNILYSRVQKCELLWLPIIAKIDYKLCLLVDKTLLSNTPGVGDTPPQSPSNSTPAVSHPESPCYDTLTTVFSFYSNQSLGYSKTGITVKRDILHITYFTGCATQCTLKTQV